MPSKHIQSRRNNKFVERSQEHLTEEVIFKKTFTGERETFNVYYIFVVIWMLFECFMKGFFLPTKLFMLRNDTIFLLKQSQ